MLSRCIEQVTTSTLTLADLSFLWFVETQRTWKPASDLTMADLILMRLWEKTSIRKGGHAWLSEPGLFSFRIGSTFQYSRGHPRKFKCTEHITESTFDRTSDLNVWAKLRVWFCLSLQYSPIKKSVLFIECRQELYTEIPHSVILVKKAIFTPNFPSIFCFLKSSTKGNYGSTKGAGVFACKQSVLADVKSPRFIKYRQNIYKEIAKRCHFVWKKHFPIRLSVVLLGLP